MLAHLETAAFDLAKYGGRAGLAEDEKRAKGDQR
jgi:hypothetical protein